jgi:hypothetical protein
VASGSSPDPDAELREQIEQARAALQAAAEAQVQQVLDIGAAPELAELPPSREALAARDYEQDIGLKKVYGWVLLGLMGVQLAIADVVFVLYAKNGVAWKIPPQVIDIWLGATFVEVVGVVYVVTRYLFPPRDEFGRPQPSRRR